MSFLLALAEGLNPSSLFPTGSLMENSCTQDANEAVIAYQTTFLGLQPSLGGEEPSDPLKGKWGANEAFAGRGRTFRPFEGKVGCQ